MAGLGQHNILQEHKAWNLRRVLRAATIAKFAANVLIIRDILRHRRRKTQKNKPTAKPTDFRSMKNRRFIYEIAFS